MPRRHISCAAGALAAALLFAQAEPSKGQTAPGEPVRDSIELDNRLEPVLVPQGTARSGPPRNVLGLPPDAPGAGVAPPLGGLGDEGSSRQPRPRIGDLDDEDEDEIFRPDPEVPEFGISTPRGVTSDALPGTQDVSRHRPLAPRRHDLDPYVPIGFRLGSFLLFTELQVGTILTDNVLGTLLDPQSDVAFELAPDVRLESNWARHFFSASFTADRSWYADFPVEDDRDYQALLKGRLDVTRRTHLELELGKSQTQEGRDSISLTDILGVQTNLYEQHIIASADHTFNRLTLKLTGTIADYDYGNVADPDLFGPIPFQDIRDYREKELKLRSTYDLKPEMAVFIEGTVNEREYQEPIEVPGFRRDSTGFTVLSGLIFRPNSRLIGEIGVGWGEQQSIDDLFPPVEGLLLNADLIWMPTPMTKIEFLARSEIAEASLVDSLGAIDRFYELSIQHAFWRYLVLGAYISYEIADYVADPLVDERLKEGLTAEYYFNPYFSVYANYEHTDFMSTERANEFTENEVRLGVRIRR